MATKMKQNRENIQLIISLFIAGLLLAIILAVVNNFFWKPNPSITSNQPVNPTTQTFSTTNSFDNELFSYGERDLFAGEARTSDIREGIKSFSNGNYSQAVKFFKNALQDNKNLPDIAIYLNNAKTRIGNNSSNSTFNLAVVVPATNQPNLAREMLRGVADAQAKFNEQGGLNNRALQIIIANDSDDEQVAAKVAKTIAASPEILGVIGHNNGRSSQAGMKEYEKVGLAQISPSSAISSVKSRVFFRATLSDKKLAKKLAEHIKNKLNLNKAVVIYNSQDISSSSIKKSFEENFRQLNGNILTAIDMSNTTFNVDTSIQKAAESQVKAIVLFPDVYFVDKAFAIIQANSKLPETSKIKLFGSTVFNQVKTLKEGGEGTKELTVVVPWFSESQKSRLFAEDAAKRWGDLITFRTAFSYDATQAFIQALANTLSTQSKPSREDVLGNLELTNLSPNDTSGEELKFRDRERIGEAILIQVVGDTRSQYSFKLVNE
jgi:branched-chain amino acid transport system substrate-binding protein